MLKSANFGDLSINTPKKKGKHLMNAVMEFIVSSVLPLIGGLCLFLFGMNLMGDALERSAGSKLEMMIGKLTTGKLAGLLTGLGVTAIIQSSSATTVMVVGFVNAGIMTLHQAVGPIMGANVGTTVTAWLLSTAEISGTATIIKLFKPESFTPILAAIGFIMTMVAKDDRRKNNIFDKYTIKARKKLRRKFRKKK